MLELKNISKTYEGKPLLRDISFKVGRGETVCLLGASGSGKSTILRMIAGLEHAEGGQILFDGTDLAQTPPHLRDFGLVFQDYGLFPHLNVFDNIAFGLKMRRGRSLTSPNALENAFYAENIQHRVREMLELVNLTGFDSRKVTDLSGGEQQRVALARALAPNPRLLMLDEPLGALDRSLKEDLLDELRAILRRTKIPAIYVTHDPEEAFAIADRILVLHDGIIIRDAAPQEIWRDPQFAAVAKLLGIGNVVEGEVIAENKIKTAFGIFSLGCVKSMGEKIQLLLTESPSPSGKGNVLSMSKEEKEGEVIAQIQLTVEDVLFKQDQFQVKGRSAAPSESKGGIIIHMNDAPRIGDVLTVQVRVQCLE